MAFFCAGSSNEVKKRMKASSRPVSGSKSGSNNSSSGTNTVISSNGRVVNPFQDPKQQKQQQQQQQKQQQQQPGPVTVPLSDSDLNSRKLVVLQEYRPVDNRGLAVRRGEMVQVISEEQNWFYVRNERNKEGYVPSNHLMAPYSSMRSRTRGLGVPNPAMRHVASGSSIDIKDPAHHTGVVMYPSTSAGRPRNYSLGDENRINSVSTSNTAVAPPPPPMRRGYSPQEYNSNSLPQGQSGLSVYDQKYSPSTSSASGVASFMGTASPVGHSDGSNHSSFCSIEENGPGGGGMEEGVAPAHNGHPESSYAKSNGRPHPAHGSRDTPPPQQPQEQQNIHNYTEGPPPPLPPRSFYNQQAQPPHPPGPPTHPHPSHLSNPQGDQQYPYQAEYQQGQEVDSYASPADAIQRQQSPHLGHPRVASLNDVRLREIKRSQENGVYTEVFRGNQRPVRQNVNGYRQMDDETTSEGGSSRSRSSRKSNSRMRMQNDSYGYYDSDVFTHESDPTLNESHSCPLSGNSLTSSQTKIKKFRKNLWGVYIVTQDFLSCDENEVSVREGEHVSVWNQDDRDWYWIVKHDTSEEGFVPSCHLKELVNQDSQHPQVQEPTQQSHISEQSEDLKPPPPLPPKPPHSSQRPPTNRHHHHHQQQPSRNHAPGSGYDNHTNFRSRAATHDTRRSPLTPRNTNSGFRLRVGSDGSAQSSGGLRAHSSTASAERQERSVSPPNTPPPPYTEFDSNYQHQQVAHPTPPPPLPHGTSSSRHVSVSQQGEVPPSAYSSTHMQRTRSHGQVPYRRVNIPRTTVTEEGGQTHVARAVGRGLEGAGQRAPSPMQEFPMKSPPEIGTPVEPHPPSQRLLPPHTEGTLV